ncbi:MAG: cell wall hydrolase SleB [Brevundimonas sp.]|nr:cell wall hydrolase SleB [Brevundimonas sp.]
MRRIAVWARTEAGGWAIIAALAVVLMALGLIAFVAPRGADLDVMPVTTPAIQGNAAALTLAPDAIRDLSPAAARAWNAAQAFSTAPNPPAKPFFAPPADVQSYGRALDCLTATLYYEAGSQTAEGQAAVAQVVLNRVRHPAYPRTVCGVVFQGSERATGCQFTFTCDGALGRPPSSAGWARSRAVATGALNGRVMAQVGTATHYHTDGVAPFWAPKLAKIVQVQTHIFYRLTGAWGLPQAFTASYDAKEPEIARMAALSTAMFDAPAAETAMTEPAPGRSDIQLVSLPVFAAEPPLLTADTADDRREPAPASAPDTRITRPAARRETAAASDPLVNAGAAPPPRQRSRIATPSGW